MTITNIDQLNLEGHYTYGDYLLWQFQERVELLRGKLRQMTAPNIRHQRISGALFSEIKWFLKKSPCQIFAASFVVRLPLPSQLIKGEKMNKVAHLTFASFATQKN
jgi:Uma2 family endonuclease